MSKVVSIDEYLSKRSLSAHDGMVYRAAYMPKTFDEEARSAIFLMTDETPDSYGDIVKAAGADLKRFANNPIALRNHRSDQPIGTWSDVEQVGKKVTGKCTLGEAGTTTLIDETFKLMKQGILRAASIGFMPMEVEMMKDDQGRALYEYIIHKWELFECSVVSVPANPNALAKAMKEGDHLCRDIIEEVLDTYVKMPSGLIVSREDFEKAHKEGSGNRKGQVLEMKVSVDDVGKMVIEEVKNVLTDFTAKLAKAGIEIEDDEPAPDPLIVELEKGMEGFMKEFEPKLEEIPEEEGERRGLLKRAIDGIRSVFKSEPPMPKTEVKEPVKPVLATEEEKEALRRKLLAMEAEELAA